MARVGGEEFAIIFPQTPTAEAATVADQIRTQLEAKKWVVGSSGAPLREGVIHLVRHQRNGSALILQRAGPGSILAEASLYSARYHCDAWAETAASTWSVSRAELRSRIAESPQLSEAWADHLASEVQRARLHAEILSLKTVAERLDAWIAWNGAPPAKGRGALVAMEIGITPEALYRECAKGRRTEAPRPRGLAEP